MEVMGGGGGGAGSPTDCVESGHKAAPWDLDN